MINFPQNFDMAYRTIKRVSVPNLNSFGPTKTELQAKEVGEFSIMLYGKIGWWHSLALLGETICSVQRPAYNKNLHRRVNVKVYSGTSSQWSTIQLFLIHNISILFTFSGYRNCLE